jgi:hypothetical protein
VAPLLNEPWVLDVDTTIKRTGIASHTRWQDKNETKRS